jgi:Secretion system C-terminal sorting domain
MLTVLFKPLFAFKMKKITTIFSLFLSLSAFSQNGDCIRAISICKKDSLIITFSMGSIKNEVTTTNTACFGVNGGQFYDVESQSVWIKWQVLQSGTFTFSIAPNNVDEDVDFAVYKITDDSCNTKTWVRCMASGTTGGGCSLIGATGLREGETDISEGPGCSPTQNNFLSPLAMQAGERYALFINDFTAGGSKAVVKFGGTATLACNTTAVSSEKNEEIISPLFPNPAHENVSFETRDKINKALIVNNLGVVIKSKNFENEQQNLYKIPTNDLPRGAYFILIETQDGRRIYRQLVIQ